MKFIFFFFAVFTTPIIICPSQGKLFHHSLFNNREPPVPFQARDAKIDEIVEEWIGVPLDHFSNTPTSRFGMRYLTNSKFFEKDGSPIFIILGGEWTISPGWLLGGHMYEIARDVGGFMMYTEHRYYGQSWPAWNTSTENLKYLYIDQALADVIELIKTLKHQPRFVTSKVIVFGGSYAGNMAQWIRYKYPEHIDGALASSGPVFAKADFYEYLETVGDSLRIYGGEDCVETISHGIKHTQHMLQRGDIESVQKAYGLCNPIDATNDLDVQYFFSIITETFSGVVQYGSPQSIKETCNRISSIEGNDMEKLGVFINPSSICFDTRYSESVNELRDPSYDSLHYTMRLWFYQTCTEYGFYQTTSSNSQPFGFTVPLSFFTDNMCPDFYGPEFNMDRLLSGIERTNTLYGGLTPNVTKVFTVHGTIDPWHRLGIMEDINEDSPTVVINGTSHCVDLQAESFSDIPELTAARSKIRSYIMKWLSD